MNHFNHHATDGPNDVYPAALLHDIDRRMKMSAAGRERFLTELSSEQAPELVTAYRQLRSR